MAERRGRDRYHSETGYPSQRPQRGGRGNMDHRPRRGSESQFNYLKELERREKEQDPMLLFEYMNDTEDEFDQIIGNEKLSFSEVRSLAYILTHSHFDYESPETSGDINLVYGKLIDSAFITSRRNLEKLIDITFNDLVRENIEYQEETRCIRLLIKIVSLIKNLLNKFHSESENLRECITLINTKIGQNEYKATFGPHEMVSFKDLYTQFTRISKTKTAANEDDSQVKSKPQPHLFDIDSNNYGDHFRSIPIYPTYHEIRNPSNPELRALVKHGEYEDQETYLDIHFKLLREDMVYPLKLAIKNLLELDKNIGAQLYTYDNVRLRRITANHTHGLIYMISFNPFGIKNKDGYDWTRSTRLKFGSLLCISQKNKHGYPNFENPLWAVVTHSDEKEIKETGLISIKFKSGFEPNFKFNTDYFMVESREVYFEAYCHVLSVLQEIEITRSLPFQPILLGKKSTCHPPAYIDYETMLDFTAIVSETQPSRVLALDIENWPKPHELNQSQYNAIKLAFTSELALIQGPPGTGKTYVGMAIVKIFLRTRRYELKVSRYDVLLDEAFCQRPIFVITHTNHAVDQFLEKIMEEDDNVIRIGSRSESELVKTRTLYEVKKQAFDKDADCTDAIRRSRRQYGEIKRQLQNLAKVIEEYTSELKCTNGISREDLKRVASDHHYKSMYTTQRKGYTTVMNQCTHMSEVWLRHLGVQTSVSEKVIPAEPVIPIEKNPFSIIASLDLTIPDDKEIADKYKIVETRLEYLDMKGEIEAFGLDGPNVNETNSAVTNEIVGAATNLVDAQDSDDDDEFNENLHELEEDHSSLFDTPEGIATAQLAEEEKITLVEAVDKLKEALDNIETKTKVSQAVLDETNIWKLSQEDRELLHEYWLERKVQTLGLVIKSYADKYLAKSKELEAVSNEVDLYYLRSAAVIGMTTTGAAKNVKLLRKLEPRIIIVEEAAEVLEAHIITSLSEHVEHLIMIGDHEQLRPSNAVYSLATHYNLNLSLFERLIENNVDHITLDCQHRMRPEISKIMQIVYPILTDHNLVTKYERIRGVTTNLFFIAHNHLEDDLKEDSTSRSNAHEAKFVIKLALYLLKQGYKQSEITLLTFYNGQRFLLKDLLSKEKEDFDFNITTVDKYQGEENEIVILSVVRGNKENYIGHCCVDNRVCVAFSRAKKGFFVIGNMQRLRTASKKTKSDRWNKILNRFEKEKCLGTSLSLCCERHDKTVTKVANGEDFAKVKDGGCSLKCETILSCSHQCPLLCHAEEEHVNIQCTMPCPKQLACTHRCPGICTEDCSRFKCGETIEKQAPCGHMIRGACSLDETEFFDIPCTVKCTITLHCGHPCEGSCDVCLKTSHAPCLKFCPNKLICGHECKYICHFPFECPPCSELCSRSCSHSKCPYLCGDLCTPCPVQCISTCEHASHTWTCNDKSKIKLCSEKCKLKLPCGHNCVGLCGEVCPKECRVCEPHHDTFQIFFGEEGDEDCSFVTLPDCGHVFELKGLEEHFKTFVENNDSSLLACPRCNAGISTYVRFHDLTRGVITGIDRCKLDSREKIRQNLFRKCNAFNILLEANPSAAISVKFCGKIPHLIEHIQNSNSYKLYILSEIMNIFIDLCSKEYIPELWCENSPLTQLIQHKFVDSFFNYHQYTPMQERMKLSEVKKLYRTCPIFAMFELTDKDRLSSKQRSNFNHLKYKYDYIVDSSAPESIFTQYESFLCKIREKCDPPLPKSITLYREYIKPDIAKSKSPDVLVERSIIESEKEKQEDIPAAATNTDEPPRKLFTAQPRVLVESSHDCVSDDKSEDEWV